MLTKNNYTITQNFGMTSYAKAHPDIYAAFGGIHPGIDLVGDDDIPCMIGGTCFQSGQNGGWGNTVTVYDRGFYYIYAHCKAVYPKVGDSIKQGDKIAKMGNTGVSTGKHLHFGKYYVQGGKNKYVDPYEDLINYFKDNLMSLIEKHVKVTSTFFKDLIAGKVALGQVKGGKPYIIRNSKKEYYKNFNELLASESALWVTQQDADSIPDN